MSILVGLHNLTRWIVVILAIFALYRAYSGWLGKKPYTATDRKAGMFFGIGMDVQLLLGLILYFVGNWGVKAFAAAQSLPADQRMKALFFALEHSPVMLLAVILTHVGSVMSRKAPDDASKHKRAAIWFTIVVILVAIAIPWMQRPLIPSF
jgi:hypothetical protein